MAVRLLQNPYNGVNAHLHSMAQNPVNSPTIWTSIYASLIGDITNRLNQQLPLNYIARTEQSLSIWTEDMGIESRRMLRPDSSIYLTGVSTNPTTSAAIMDDPSVRIVSLKHLLDDEDIFTPSVVIYKNEYMGEPITRIELLSPTNKRGGSGYQAYQGSRLMALHSGTSLIELDYLHQSLSSLPEMSPYPEHPDSHPYSLAVTDCRLSKNPDWNMLIYLRDVDITLPTHVTIPLAGDDDLIFDFNAVYQFTFEIGRWGTHIDYEQRPVNFESYSQADQKRILQVMERAKTMQST